MLHAGGVDLLEEICPMRGHASLQAPEFCMIDMELELPKHHPLRAIDAEVPPKP